jgi:hypothetical protein
MLRLKSEHPARRLLNTRAVGRNTPGTGPSDVLTKPGIGYRLDVRYLLPDFESTPRKAPPNHNSVK